ncbi:hypothetical protein VNO77_28774 [Canavalia gladiata]|uniref:Secreted protein n=1 Tax=Canavalia gladiata TaxID=3824 RepID=A0AAN9Q7Y2_CANGL
MHTVPAQIPSSCIWLCSSLPLLSSVFCFASVTCFACQRNEVKQHQFFDENFSDTIADVLRHSYLVITILLTGINYFVEK